MATRPISILNVDPVGYIDIRARFFSRTVYVSIDSMPSESSRLHAERVESIAPSRQMALSCISTAYKLPFHTVCEWFDVLPDGYAATWSQFGHIVTPLLAAVLKDMSRDSAARYFANLSKLSLIRLASVACFHVVCVASDVETPDADIKYAMAALSIDTKPPARGKTLMSGRHEPLLDAVSRKMWSVAQSCVMIRLPALLPMTAEDVPKDLHVRQLEARYAKPFTKWGNPLAPATAPRVRPVIASDMCDDVEMFPRSTATTKDLLGTAPAEGDRPTTFTQRFGPVSTVYEKAVTICQRLFGQPNEGTMPSGSSL